MLRLATQQESNSGKDHGSRSQDHEKQLRVPDKEEDGIILHLGKYLVQNVLEVRAGSVGLVRSMLPWSRPEMVLAWIRLWNLQLLPS